METVLPENFYEHWDKIMQTKEPMLSVDKIEPKLIAYTEVQEDYDGFFCEIFDDLETFYVLRCF